MFRRFFTIGVVLLLLPLFAQFAFAADTGAPTISLNASSVSAKAYVDDGSLYLPLRSICESLGYDVSWSAKDQTATVNSSDRSFALDFANWKINANGHDYYMSDGHIVINGSTYMNADFFADNLALKIQWNREQKKVELNSVVENTVTVKTIKEAYTKPGLDVTLQYPQLSGSSNSAMQDKMNAVFKQEAQKAAAEGVKNAADLEQYRKDFASSNPNNCETYFDYQIKYNSNDIMSLIFLNYQFAGGAHGSTVQTAYTFSLKTGDQYSLKDLFVKDADYVSVISAAVKKQLDERDLTSGLFEPFTKIAEDQGYYLSNDGLRVYFQQYEILPYAAGIQEFTADFSAIKSIFKYPDMFKDSGLLYKNEQLGFSLQFPADWAGDYQIVPTSNGIDINYMPMDSSQTAEKLFSVINYGTEAKWNADWHSLEQKAGVINGIVYAWIGRADFPYDPTNTALQADSKRFSAMYDEVNSIAKSFTEIPNADKSATMLLRSIMDNAKLGKVINCVFPDNTTVIEDVISAWGNPANMEFIAAAKGTYSDYPKHNVTFGFNKGDQVFEVRSFDPALTKITLSKSRAVFGKPDYTAEVNGEKIIGYVANADYKILLVFPASTGQTADPALLHYSVLYPKVTPNNMSGDPGREW